MKKVFSILECQVETRAMMRPGSSTADTATGNIERPDPCGCDPTKQNVSTIFPSSVVRLAQTRRRNLPESIPPSGKIRQGPVFKALDKPKLAVKRDVAKVRAKKSSSEPIIAMSDDSLLLFAFVCK